MRTNALHALPLVAVAALATTSSAYAASAADEATAEALFQEGKRLMAAGDYAHACPKLAESQRLDSGSGTLLHLALCYEKIGKLASAWGAYTEAETAARATGNKERQDEAARRAAELGPRVPKLTIVVPPSAKVPGFEIKRDGAVVGEGQYGFAIPIDPGDHILEARAPGRRTWTNKITVAGLGTQAVEVPLLMEGPADETSTPAPFWRAQRIAGVVVGGAGLVAVAVSLGVGARAKSIYSDSLGHCLPNDPTKCYAEGVTLRNQAYQVGNLATPIFVAGAIGVVGGTIVFLTTPSGARLQVRPTAGPGSGSITVSGAW
jgi:hypothetical protein